MPILKLRGSSALSDFRFRKLNTRLQALDSSLAVTAADYWHFVESAAALGDAERGVLQRLLDDGLAAPAAGRVSAAASASRFALVVPRIGTISPWSSKATDIAVQCGLPGVKRIER